MTGAHMLLPACLGLSGIATGMMWRVPAVARRDALLMRRINRGRFPSAGDRVLSSLRMAGTTPFFLAVLGLVALARPAWAPSLALAAVAGEGITKALKMASRRQRPFAADAETVVRLPRLPVDPGFPSGDAMRAAFMSGLTVAGKAFPWWGVFLCLLLAVIVGVGRVRAGAHYPLDVWAGLAIGWAAVLAWLGAIGA